MMVIRNIDVPVPVIKHILVAKGLENAQGTGINQLRLDIGTNLPVLNFLKRLAPNFATAEGTDSARERYEKRIQQPDEMLMDYYNAKHMLYQRAYPTAPHFTAGAQQGAAV